MRLNEENYRRIYSLIDEKISELEYPCDHCLYFDCIKNPYARQLLKKFREMFVVGWEECLKQKREELQEWRCLLKAKEFSRFRAGYIKRRKENEKRLRKTIKRVLEEKNKEGSLQRVAV